MITRIRELLDTRQLTPTQFADLIGVGRPVISHILSERNKPSLEVVQKIIGAFPDIALPWLLAGTGPMLAADATAPTANTLASPLIRPESSPIVVASPPIPPPFTAPPPAPASPSRTTPLPPPAFLPQPPKFRPLAAPSPLVAPRSLPTPASAPGVATAEPELVAATPPPAAPAPQPSPELAGPPPPASAAAPTSGASPAPITSPTTPGPEDLAASSDTVAAGTNPAAALSFLGEPGKAIRRIVIFYRDGSFSDYLPDAR